MKRVVLAAVVAVGLFVGCEITQEHIDAASEQLAEATQAIGQPPSAVAVAAAAPLRREHLAGSTWRIVEVADWPDAAVVVTLGSNGRTVWHVAPAHLQSSMHWAVVGGGALVFGGLPAMAGLSVDADNVCLRDGSAACAYVVQRVAP